MGLCSSSSLLITLSPDFIHFLFFNILIIVLLSLSLNTVATVEQRLHMFYDLRSLEIQHDILGSS